MNIKKVDSIPKGNIPKKKLQSLIEEFLRMETHYAEVEFSKEDYSTPYYMRSCT